jgi:hypothetical protein
VTTLRRVLLGLVILCVPAFIAVGAEVNVAGASCYNSLPVYPVVTDASGQFVAARESVAWPGTTCDGDYYYSGAVQDSLEDGSCAYVYYLEVFQYYATQGVECTTNDWELYSYTDIYGNNHVFLLLAANFRDTGWLDHQTY